MATGQLALLQAPLPTDQQLGLLHRQRLRLQPAAHRGGQGKGGLDRRLLTAAAQQARPLGSLGTTEESIERIKKNRFARARLAGEHGEAPLKAQLQLLNQSDVLQAQPCQHWRPFTERL